MSAPPAGQTNRYVPIQYKHGKNGRADIHSKSFKRKKKHLYNLIKGFENKWLNGKNPL